MWQLCTFSLSNPSQTFTSIPLLYQGGHRHESNQKMLLRMKNDPGSQNYQRSLVFHCKETCFQVVSKCSKWTQSQLSGHHSSGELLGWGSRTSKYCSQGTGCKYHLKFIFASRPKRTAHCSLSKKWSICCKEFSVLHLQSKQCGDCGPSENSAHH